MFEKNLLRIKNDVCNLIEEKLKICSIEIYLTADYICRNYKAASPGL